MRLAIVVPTLNEEHALRAYLALAIAEADDLIVSDGGSTDRTLDIARELGAKIVAGNPGRGVQLNRGAAAVPDTDILLFLHADTVLPPGSGNAVRRAIENGASGGAFFVRFDAERPLFRLGSGIVNLRTRLTKRPLGDQAQFVRRDVFERLGGFREWPILEDLDFAGRLNRAHGLALLPGPAVTAARRYVEGGITKTIATNWLIWLLFAVGVSPERLARLYGHIR
ncbi:MAG TPA: TIGR04283 family arsenosugar biosynthesis glycosyltransferase [Thermoanaerobaculia bacterium]|jgi:rSAM/selenodomain-associated transferase 2|nr:TIGR04283 family arsenosugar biosynthesis glycosyltransferase [Thermoanaerobaculia bacterium]